MPPGTPEVWNTDHFCALAGMLNEHFIHAQCKGLRDLMEDYAPDAVVDFWNPCACMAARAMKKPLISVIQADMHPESRGFIWWKEPPEDIPTPVPVVNKVLAAYDLQPVKKMGELFIGDLTLVIGMPETDPLPEKSNGTYIGPIIWQKPFIINFHALTVMKK